MANALTLTAAAMPVANGPLAGVIDGANSNGANSAAYTYANGAPGAADTIDNANLLAGVTAARSPRLHAFLTATFANAAAANAAWAALGGSVAFTGAHSLAWVAAASTVSATCTTTATTGTLRLSVGYSPSL